MLMYFSTFIFFQSRKLRPMCLGYQLSHYLTFFLTVQMFRTQCHVSGDVCEVQTIPSLCQEAVPIHVSSVQTIYGCMPVMGFQAPYSQQCLRSSGGQRLHQQHWKVVSDEDCTRTWKENVTSYLPDKYFKTSLANQKDELYLRSFTI